MQVTSIYIIMQKYVIEDCIIFFSILQISCYIYICLYLIFIYVSTYLYLYLFTFRLNESCARKCIIKYTDGDLAVGEMACVDRCVGKYMQAQEKVGYKKDTYFWFFCSYFSGCNPLLPHYHYILL